MMERDEGLAYVKLVGVIEDLKRQLGGAWKAVKARQRRINELSVQVSKYERFVTFRDAVKRVSELEAEVERLRCPACKKNPRGLHKSGLCRRCIVEGT